MDFKLRLQSSSEMLDEINKGILDYAKKKGIEIKDKINNDKRRKTGY